MGNPAQRRRKQFEKMSGIVGFGQPIKELGSRLELNVGVGVAVALILSVNLTFPRDFHVFAVLGDTWIRVCLALALSGLACRLLCIPFVPFIRLSVGHSFDLINQPGSSGLQPQDVVEGHAVAGCGGHGDVHRGDSLGQADGRHSGIQTSREKVVLFSFLTGSFVPFFFT